MRVLFVCTGNTCRSPMAEAIFTAMAADRGIDASADSCGIAALPSPAAENAVKAAARYGAELGGHVAKQVTGELVIEADRVYTMTDGHRRALIKLFPEYESKILTLCDRDISDPFGADESVYEQCAAQIYAALEDILEDLR